MFPDEAAAEAWFEKARWPDGERSCPKCGSVDAHRVKSRKPIRQRARRRACLEIPDNCLFGPVAYLQPCPVPRMKRTMRGDGMRLEYFPYLSKKYTEME